jgi:predicted amidohydrolase YtcJ
MESAALLACDVALRTGITSVHTLLDTPNQMIAWSRLRRKIKLPLRITAMPPHAAVDTLHSHGIRTTFGDHTLRFGACKLFSDGSLGAQTALLADPYSDKPETKGLRIYDPQDLKQKALTAQQKGFQLAIHAIGDQALRETLDAIEHALANESNEHHRHRVEHASLCAPDCLERMAARKIIAVVQPQFVTSDTWTPDRIGPERTRWAYPFKSLLQAGVPIALSSDCPVEKLDAFACLAAAVGRAPWSPDQTLTPTQALQAYSSGSAFAAHADHYCGSLTPGKVADFVILSADPTHLTASQIEHLRAEQVFIAGKSVLRSEL